MLFRSYIDEKLITPFYKRFVDIVARGRAELGPNQARDLADGSIYYAVEAKEKKLVDSIGYLGEAIEQARSMAGLKEARVVDYERPFSMLDVFGSGQMDLDIKPELVYELGTPKFLYIWTAAQ